jgi:Methyltransferase domain
MKINSITIDSSQSTTDLCHLGGHVHQTDKSPYNNVHHRHPYTAVYDFIFSNKRYDKLNIGEFGILYNMSMKCWRDYFKNSTLHGFDFDEKLLNEAISENLYDTTYDLMNIKDATSIEDSFQKYGNYDLIVEDTTHEFNDQIRFANIAYKYLNTGGILIIEDIFRNAPEQLYNEALENISKYFSTMTFVVCDHKMRYSPGWDNDKLLFMIRNDVPVGAGGIV